MAERFAAYLRRATTRRLNTSGVVAKPTAATEPESSSSDFAAPNESVPLLPQQHDDIDSIESVNIVPPDEIDDGIFPSSFQWKDVRASIRAQKPNVDLVRKRARYYVPILSWLPKYQWKRNIVSDLIAGVGVAAMLIPQSLAYASLATLPPAYGLYTAFVPLIVYFIFGTSKQLSVGPDALSSLLIGLTLAGEQFDDASIDATVIAPVIAFLVGLILLILGLLRVGFIDTILSKPLLSGFINAVAVTILFEQLEPLFGLKTNSKVHGFRKIGYFFDQLPNLNWITFGMGFCAIYLLFLIKYAKKKWPPLRYVPETLVVVVLGTLICGLARLDQYNVAILGHIEQGIPVPSPPRLDKVEIIATFLGDAAVIALVGFVEHIVAGKTYATKNGYPISANRELVALGSLNGIGSFFHTYPTFASLPRSQIADTLGAQSQIFALVASVLIMFTLLFLGPAFHYLPKVVMAAIIVVASIGLLSLEEIVFLFRVRAWADLALAGLTFLLTIFLGVELGIGISISISILFVLKHSSVPSVILLGRIPETNKFRDVALFKEAELQNGFIVVRLDESLYFANIGQLQSVLDRLERFGAPHAHPSEVEKEKTLEGVILHVSNVATIDASALESLHTTVEDYRKRQIKVAFVKARASIRSSLIRAGVTLDNQAGTTFFDSVHNAIEFMKSSKVDDQDKENSVS